MLVIGSLENGKTLGLNLGNLKQKVLFVYVIYILPFVCSQNPYIVEVGMLVN